MKTFQFYNIAYKPIASIAAEKVDDDPKKALLWLFSDFENPPPDDAMTLISESNNRQHWLVGPFDVILETRTN